MPRTNQVNSSLKKGPSGVKQREEKIRQRIVKKKPAVVEEEETVVEQNQPQKKRRSRSGSKSIKNIVKYRGHNGVPILRALPFQRLAKASMPKLPALIDGKPQKPMRFQAGSLALAQLGFQQFIIYELDAANLIATKANKRQTVSPDDWHVARQLRHNMSLPHP